MDHHAQVDAIGASNYKLLEAGVVKWEDIVRPTRVLDLKEVVNEQRLTVDQMIKAGVRKDIAEKAYAGAHTAKAQIVREARQQALKNLENAGISREQVYKHVSQVIGQRVGIGAGPSGPSMPPPRTIIPPKPSGPKLPPTLRAAMEHFAPRPIPAAPVLVKVAEKAAPLVARKVEEIVFHERVMEAVGRVPPERFFGEKAWIHDVYEAFQGDPSNPRMTIEAFKGLLLEAHNKLKLQLARIDLVQAVNLADIRAAQTDYKLGDRVVAEFHFVRRVKR